MPNDMRDRLVELLTDNFPHCDNPLQDTYDEIVERLANHLIENGVILPPCKVGKTVWICTSPVNISGYEFNGDGEQDEIFECVIGSITFYEQSNQVRCYCNGKFVAHYLRLSDFGKTVFLTREDAEKALRERDGE